jgi:hypothetical protein
LAELPRAIRFGQEYKKCCKAKKRKKNGISWKIKFRPSFYFFRAISSIEKGGKRKGKRGLSPFS